VIGDIMTSAADTTEALVTADIMVEALLTAGTMVEALVTAGTRWVTAVRRATVERWATVAGITTDKQRLLSAGERVCVRQPCLSLPLVPIP
jgi:hypothetical protein